MGLQEEPLVLQASASKLRKFLAMAAKFDTESSVAAPASLLRTLLTLVDFVGVLYARSAMSRASRSEISSTVFLTSAGSSAANQCWILSGAALSFLLPVTMNGDEDTAVFAYHGVVALDILTFGAHLCWTALSDGKPDLDVTFHDALFTLVNYQVASLPSSPTSLDPQLRALSLPYSARHQYSGSVSPSQAKDVDVPALATTATVWSWVLKRS
jgi:hypothetical protein